MRSQFSGSFVPKFAFTLLRVVALCLLLSPAALMAQDEEPSLGDLARNLRRQKAQQQVEQAQPEAPPAIIDNDNLAQATEDAKRVKAAQKIVFSVDSSGKNFSLMSPDINCRMAFDGRASSLMKPLLIEDLPFAELLKLDGPGSIQDDTLQLDLLNGTEWELREITVGITLERKPGENAELAARARVVPAAQNSAAVTLERRSDMTLLYHLKATAKPFSTTIFREDIGITPSVDEDWRWSIVEAKGIRPGRGGVPPEALPGAQPLATGGVQSSSSSPDAASQETRDRGTAPSDSPKR